MINVLGIFKNTLSKVQQKPIDTLSRLESSLKRNAEEIAATVVLEEKKPISSAKANKMFKEASQMLDEYLKMDTLKLFSDAPLYLKINFVLHAFKLSNIDDDSHVDWKAVNMFLHDNPIPFDFNVNIPEVFTCIEEIVYANAAMFMALRDIQPFYITQCKSCDNDFSLKYGEIKFYIENDLYIPRKCTDCRKNKQ